MAISLLSSQVVTDLDASPVVKSNQLEVGGVTREAIATLALTAAQVDGDITTSIWRMLRVPARARVISLEMVNDDLDGATPTLAVNVGLYEVNGGVAKDADFFASAITDLQAAVTAWLDITYESAVVGVEIYQQPLWQQLGDTDNVDNRGKEYDIALSPSTVAGANPIAGDITMKVKYVLYE